MGTPKPYSPSRLMKSLEHCPSSAVRPLPSTGTEHVRQTPFSLCGGACSLASMSHLWAVFHALTLRKARQELSNRRTVPSPESKTTFLRPWFDVVPTNPVEANRGGHKEPDVPSNGRNLTCPVAENQLQDRNARVFASTIAGRSRVHVDLLRKLRMRERGTERAVTGCPSRYAKGAPIPQMP